MSQSLSATTLLTVALAPLVGAVVTGVFGTALGGNRAFRADEHDGRPHPLGNIGEHRAAVGTNGKRLVGRQCRGVGLPSRGQAV